MWGRWMVGDNLEWEIMAPQRLGIYAIWHDGYGVGLPPNARSAPTASSAACRNCCSSRAAGRANGVAALLWFFAATAASGQTNSNACDRAAVVQATCQQYATAQTGMPVDVMYAHCMYARGYRVPGFSPSPNTPVYQGEFPGPAAHS